MSFDLNPELSQAIHRLQEVIIQDDDEDSELAGMVDISKVSVLFTVNDFSSDLCKMHQFYCNSRLYRLNGHKINTRDSSSFVAETETALNAVSDFSTIAANKKTSKDETGII